MGREGGVGGGGHHQPIHRLPLGSCSGSPSFLLSSFLPPNLLLAAVAAAPLAAGEGPRGPLRARLVFGWRREKEGREAVSERRLAGREREREGERGREEGGGIFRPDLSAAAPRSTSIGCLRGHAESPIGQAVSVEEPPCAHSPDGFKARVGWAGSGMGRTNWPRGVRLGWGRQELATDWIGLVKALSSDRLSAGRRVDRRQDSGPA